MDPLHERGNPEADAVAGEGEEREAERGPAQGGRAEDQREALGIAQGERLRPRDRGVDAHAEGAPLGGVSGERDERRGAGRDRRGGRGVAPKRRRASGRTQMDQREGRHDRAELAPEGAPRVRLRRHRQPLRVAAHGLPQAPHPEREQEPREAHDQVRDLPAPQPERRRAPGPCVVPRVHRQAPDPEAEARAQVDPRRVEREHRRPPCGREAVREHRVRGRVRAGLADPDADACRGELAERPREAGERRHAAPHREPQRDRAATGPAVRQPAERNPEHRVEDRERGPVQEAEILVGEAEVAADLLGEDREDLAVEEVEEVDDDQDAEQVARVRPADVGRRPRARVGLGSGAMGPAFYGTLVAPIRRKR